MRYNDLIDTLQNLINFKPSQKDIGNILGLAQTAISGRAQRNSNFTDEEIKKIEHFYNILLRGSSSDDCIEIDHIHINPSCGKGTVVLDEAEITPIKLGTQMIQSVLKISHPHNLKTFKACGDSMETIIEDGDMLLVDTGRTDFNNGGIFLLTINNDWFVKRLRLRVTGELDIISDNDKYPIESLKPDSNVIVTIKGRVIKNLSRGL